jgi:pimeloyl-ACP methyl ester carboxylesterase
VPLRVLLTSGEDKRLALRESILRGPEKTPSDRGSKLRSIPLQQPDARFPARYAVRREWRIMDPKRTLIQSNDGTQIPVWSSGRGRPLLIVHGAAGTHDTWEMMRPLLDSHFEVTIMNRRVTFGDPLSPLEMTREFEDVAAVARSLGDHVVLLGHSSGAQCALGAAPMIPQLEQLLVYEPPLDLDRTSPHYRVVLPKLERLLRVGDIDGVYDVWLKEYVRMPEEVAEQVKASPIGQSMRPLAQYLPREMAAHLDWNFDVDGLQGVTARTTYLVGSETPAENAELRGFIRILEHALKDFEVREIPGQGHFANFFAPELLAGLVLELAEADV